MGSAPPPCPVLWGLWGLAHPESAKPVCTALGRDLANQGVVEQAQGGKRKAVRALEDAGYLMEEVEPPSIEVAATTLLGILNIPEIRAS